MQPRSFCHHSRRHHVPLNGSVENLGPGFNAPKLIDRGEINIAGDKDVDEFTLIFVQRGRNIDRLLDGDGGGGIGDAGGIC
jgi:hypothetical protein